MTAPVTDLGQQIKSTTYSATNPWYNSYAIIHRYRQKKPFNLMLPYYRYDADVKTFYTNNPSFRNAPSWSIDNPPFSVDYAAVENASYEKLKGKLYDQAGLGVDFVEYHQSVSMIADSAVRLARAARDIRRLNFRGALSQLGMKAMPPGVSLKKSFANNFLEFHFGWSPLISDIHDACEVLNNPVKSFTFEKSRVRDLYDYSKTTDFGSTRRLDTFYGITFAQQGGRIKAITNAGLHTLDQFGIINPVSLVWETVPFSFVVDWFVNVGSFISSFSDFAGMTLDSTFCTTGYKVLSRSRDEVKPGYGTSYSTWNCSFTSMNRATSLSGVTLSVSKLKLPSLTRATTAVSLLTQSLRGIK